MIEAFLTKRLTNFYHLFRAFTKENRFRSDKKKDTLLPVTDDLSKGHLTTNVCMIAASQLKRES